MKITVYGPGCARCKQTEEIVRQAVAQSGVEADVEHIGDFAAMAKAGILVTPAVAIDDKVMARGKVPSVPEVVGWLTTARAEA